MKENLKKIGIILISIIFILSFFTTVHAIDNTFVLLSATANDLVNISMSAVDITGQEINKGETFVLEIRASDITLGTGIAVVQGTFEFNEDALEIVQTDKENNEVNDWTRSYNPTKKKFLLDRQEKVNQDQVIARFTFKVKETCTTTSTTINLIKLSANDENEITNIGNRLVNIGISLTEEKDDSNNDNNNNNNNNNNENNNSNSNDTNNNNNNDNNSGTNNGNNTSNDTEGGNNNSSITPTNSENNSNNGTNDGNSNNNVTPTNSENESNNGNTNKGNSDKVIVIDETTSKTSTPSKNSTNNSGKKIPNLGWEKTPIIIAIIAFVIVGIVLYFKYYMYNV